MDVQLMDCITMGVTWSAPQSVTLVLMAISAFVCWFGGSLLGGE